MHATSRPFITPHCLVSHHANNILISTCSPPRLAGCYVRVGVPVHFPSACFAVHSRAVLSYFARSFSNIRAISGTNGSFGFGSVSSEQIESSTLLMVSAGDHCCFRISRPVSIRMECAGWGVGRRRDPGQEERMNGADAMRPIFPAASSNTPVLRPFSVVRYLQMPPFPAMLGWYILVVKATFGGLNG